MIVATLRSIRISKKELRDILNNTNMTLEELVNENFNTLFKVGTSLYIK